MKITLAQSLEWFGVLTAIVYSLLVASNTGLEFLGFALLLISAFSIGLWAYLGGHRGILLLQFFYATAGIIGMLRWFLTTPSRWRLHRKRAVSGLSTMAFMASRLTFFLRQFETIVATFQHRCLFPRRCLQNFSNHRSSLLSHARLFLNGHLGIGKCRG